MSERTVIDTDKQDVVSGLTHRKTAFGQPKPRTREMTSMTPQGERLVEDWIDANGGDNAVERSIVDWVFGRKP